VSDEFDVVVGGAGPAGAAAALTLARAGRSVLMMELALEGPARVGEALAPAARPVLRELGLLDQLAARAHLPCYGNLSVWGTDEAQTADFLFNPYGHGWHVDRARFGAVLRDAAVAVGAVLRVGRLVQAERLAGGRWLVRIDRGAAGGVDLGCAWLVDATGRRSTIARRHGAARLRDDALVALHARFRPAPGGPGDSDSRTIVEATPAGWWYSALVPAGERVVAFLTDADLLNAATRTPEGFCQRLREARHLRRRLDGHGYRIAGRPRGAAAGGARLGRFAGEGWVAVGDAALAFDPLSSQGLLCALETGSRAGRAIDCALAGDTAPLSDYARAVDRIYTAYREGLAACYAAERRWPDQPFWRRRLTGQHASEG
jgi:flavin-dependent dehydrogenase